MRLLALPLLLAAASASAATITMTVSSEDGGAKSRISWNVTGGTVTYVMPQGGIAYNYIGFGGTAADSVPTGLVPITTGTFFSTQFTVTAGLTMTNTRTGETQSVDQFRIIAGPEMNNSGTIQPARSVLLLGLSQNTPNGTGSDSHYGVAGVGGDIFELGGATSGTFVVDYAFTNFNTGVWQISQGDTFNILSTGGVVPEPSTYGLALGGLALVGAVIRRRAKRA